MGRALAAWLIQIRPASAKVPYKELNLLKKKMKELFTGIAALLP
jgi:hypothetical protein